MLHSPRDRGRLLGSLAAGLLLALVSLASLPPDVEAAEPECRCVSENGCYHFLGAPVKPPDEPCSCPMCRAARGSCPKRWPESWPRGNTMASFLGRHAASWRITCSECLEDAAGDPEGAAFLARQMKIERRMFGAKRKIVVARSPHFYLVTDIPELRLVVQGGGSRRMRMHELAHVFLMRAELAYEDWTKHLDDRMTLERPSAIFLTEKESMKRRVAQAYLGHVEPEILYGADAKSISGGYGYNGLAISIEKHSGDDRLHFQMRHLIGHLFASTWVTGGGATKILPRWMYVGAAHFLSRLPEKFEDRATFCSGEGFAVSGSGRNWPIKLRKAAALAHPTPIQRVFDAKALDDLDIEMHRRAWSWFDLFLAEDHDRFVAFMAAIREGTDQRVAMRRAFGIEPEVFDERWRDRILGRRRTLKPTPAELDAATPDAEGAREHIAIRGEWDPDTLGSRIRALHAVKEPLTAATIVTRLEMPSDLVRESIVMVLSRTESEDVRHWLRTRGLEDQSGHVRSQIVRVLGDLRDVESAGALVSLAGDHHWLTRAHVARALGAFRRPEDRSRLVTMLRDRSSKVRIAALDALAGYGGNAADAWRPVAGLLGHKAWQVRSCAAECLGALGPRDSVDALIERMTVEAGRLRHDIREALKRITKDDLGNDPRHWREWWKKEKLRPGDPGAARPPAGPDRYSETPTYYGMRVFSRSVGFALDSSSSMGFQVELDPVWLRKHKRTYPSQGTKFDLARYEIAATLKSLDPRTRFNLFFFRTRAKAWQPEVIPATPANVRRAASATGSRAPSPALSSGGGMRTNYVDAFRLVLDAKRDQVSGKFADTPDTVFFLTDGKPTAGDIADTELLLGWFRELNRFARVRVNVVTFGKLDTNPEFLTRLAEENGGVYTRIPSK